MCSFIVIITKTPTFSQVHKYYIYFLINWSQLILLRFHSRVNLVFFWVFYYTPLGELLGISYEGITRFKTSKISSTLESDFLTVISIFVISLFFENVKYVSIGNRIVAKSHANKQTPLLHCVGSFNDVLRSVVIHFIQFSYLKGLPLLILKFQITLAGFVCVIRIWLWTRALFCERYRDTWLS